MITVSTAWAVNQSLESNNDAARATATRATAPRTKSYLTTSIRQRWQQTAFLQTDEKHFFNATSTIIATNGNCPFSQWKRSLLTNDEVPSNQKVYLPPCVLRVQLQQFSNSKGCGLSFVSKEWTQMVIFIYMPPPPHIPGKKGGGGKKESKTLRRWRLIAIFSQAPY